MPSEATNAGAALVHHKQLTNNFWVLLTYVKVIRIILSPWQFGSPNTRPQESFRMLEPLRRASEKFLKVVRVLRNAVGHKTLHIVPNELGRVQFRGVPGEEVIMNPQAIIVKESFDRPGLMRAASVPKKHKAPLQVTQEMSQEGQNLGMPDVLQGMKTDVQSGSPLTRGDRDRGDGRYLRPTTGDLKNRSLSDRRPGLADGRNKAESALIEEDHGQVKPLRLFLYAATCSVSSVLFPFHPALGLLSQASGSSSPSLSTTTRRYSGDKTLRNARPPLRRFAWLSKDQSSSRSSTLRPQARQPDSSSGARLVSMDDREQVLTSTPHHHFSYAGRSSNTPNTTSNRLSWLSPADSSLYPATRQPAGAAVRAVLGFHGVSWDQFIILLLLLRKSINS